MDALRIIGWWIGKTIGFSNVVFVVGLIWFGLFFYFWVSFLFSFFGMVDIVFLVIRCVLL